MPKTDTVDAYEIGVHKLPDDAPLEYHSPYFDGYVLVRNGDSWKVYTNSSFKRLFQWVDE